MRKKKKILTETPDAKSPAASRPHFSPRSPGALRTHSPRSRTPAPHRVPCAALCPGRRSRRRARPPLSLCRQPVRPLWRLPPLALRSAPPLRSAPAALRTRRSHGSILNNRALSFARPIVLLREKGAREAWDEGGVARRDGGGDFTHARTRPAPPAPPPAPRRAGPDTCLPAAGAGPRRRFPPAPGARRGSREVPPPPPPPPPFARKRRAIAGRFLPRRYANTAVGSHSSPVSGLSREIVGFLLCK